MRKKKPDGPPGGAPRPRTVRERAAQLERANTVLSSSVENFAVEQGPEAFLDAIMHTIASALGVHSVTMLRWTGDDYAHLHRVLEHGTVLPGEQSDHPHAKLPFFLPDYPWVTEMLAEGRHVTDVIPVSRKMGISAELLAYLRARCVRAVVTAAIRSGNRVIGSFTARLPEGHPDPGPEQFALMRSLAAQGALALEMGRLTKAARDAAVREERVRLAQEREHAARERAAQLERANAVLSSSVENFSIEQGPEAFLDAIMHTIASALSVHSVDMWRWPGDGNAYLHRVLEGGVIKPGAQTNHPNAIQPAILANFPWTREVIAGGKQITEIVPVHKREGFDPEQLAHLRARGVRAMITSTIRSGSKVIGSFSARLHKGHPDPDPERRALMRSLAAHGALALEMGRLTKAARDAAVREERVRLAQERERAAQERAAELEHVNAVLSNSIENFAIEQGPEAFLDAIMHTIAAALNVHSVTMWHWPGDDHAYLHRVLEHGTVLPGKLTDHPNAHRPASHLHRSEWVQEIISLSKQITEVLPLNRKLGMDAEQIAYLRARGVRALIVASICSGSRVIGTFCARLHKGHPNPGPERRALMRSLAAHGALALEMGRLTETARIGAIREERTRMARDLHDSLAQGFAGIIVQLEAVESALASRNLAKARARAASAGELARDSLQQARSAVHALRPSILEDRDLTTALRGLVESIFTGSSVEVDVHFNGIARPLPPEVEENLLRIAQEALTNVLKHSRARHASLSLNYRPKTLILRVHDDGRGLEHSNRLPGSSGGYGLIGIRERADRLGAALSIENQSGGGASVSVKLPTPDHRMSPETA